MYLKSVYLSGFKSFAGVTKLDFEAGITAIVGPNGSGKSNIADALRWVLGEQSTKQLRLKKNDEVVFAGSAGRAKASLAEVRVLLDNSDGVGGIDASEIEIGRILYRSGETEYRLNGRKVTLRSIQEVLASAGFGANSYAVIGQGMVDNLIIASPAERKLLFDEASGIRSHELARENALRKLESTQANMQRLQDILSELAPRLNDLQKATALVEQRQAMEVELVGLRTRHLKQASGEAEAVAQQLAAELVTVQRNLTQSKAGLAELERQQQELAASERNQQAVQLRQTKDLQRLDAARDRLLNKLTVARAELQYQTEQAGSQEQIAGRLSNLRSEVADCHQEEGSITQKLVKQQALEQQALADLEALQQQIKQAQKELNSLRSQVVDSSQQAYIKQAQAILQLIRQHLEAPKPAAPETLRLLVYKAGRTLSHALGAGSDDQAKSLQRAQTNLSSLLQSRERVHDRYTEVVIGLRSLELDQAHTVAQLERLTSEIAELERESEKSQAKATMGLAGKQTVVQGLEEDLARVTTELHDMRAQITMQPAASENIFALASKLAEAKTAITELEQRRQQLIEDQRANTAERQRLTELTRAHRPTQETPSDGDLTTAELEQRIMVLEAKLEPTSLIDGQAAQEYADVLERQQFLSSQLADLAQASDDLAEVISSLEGLIKDQFAEAFADISEHFGRYFAKLFDGGRAELVLKRDASDVYGIEIVAIPAGKKVSSLAMLSGGERALTGIALLAAILAVRPSPFVVLDEVDAALDEANSARFAGILRELGSSSQFLVITHNRQTMSAAKTLFGVTMNKHHVSSLLSMRLDEASKLAIQASQT